MAKELFGPIIEKKMLEYLENGDKKAFLNYLVIFGYFEKLDIFVLNLEGRMNLQVISPEDLNEVNEKIDSYDTKIKKYIKKSDLKVEDFSEKSKFLKLKEIILKFERIKNAYNISTPVNDVIKDNFKVFTGDNETIKALSSFETEKDLNVETNYSIFLLKAPLSLNEEEKNFLFSNLSEIKNNGYLNTFNDFNNFDKSVTFFYDDLNEFGKEFENINLSDVFILIGNNKVARQAYNLEELLNEVQKKYNEINVKDYPNLVKVSE